MKLNTLLLMVSSSPTPRGLLLTLVLTVDDAFAFVGHHPTTPLVIINHREVVLLQGSSNDVQFDGEWSFESGRECKRISQINQLLTSNQIDLLTNMSKCQALHPKSTVDADNEVRTNVTNQLLVHESILSSRFDLPFLRRTKIGPSSIDGAGRGLFAIESINKGEAITCYPGDAVLYELPDETDNIHDEIDADESNDDDNDDDDDDEGTETICLWGAHVPLIDRWDEDTVFDGTEMIQPLTAYAVSVDDEYAIMGHPALDDNPAYFDHFANDGAGQFALEGPHSQNNILAALELGLDVSSSSDSKDNDDDEEEFGVEENIAAYVLKSLEVANAMHRSLVDGLHVVTVATRDIKAGDEIFVSYGPDYWVENSWQDCVF